MTLEEMKYKMLVQILENQALTLRLIEINQANTPTGLDSEARRLGWSTMGLLHEILETK